MHVELDGHRLDQQHTSVAAALAAGVDAAEAKGRIIIEAKADGVRLTDEVLSAPPDAPSQIDVLSLTSAEPRTLASVTLYDAADAAQSIRELQAVASARLQSHGFDEEVLKAVQESLETWQALRDVVVQVAQVLQIDLATLELEGTEAGEPARRSAALVGKLGDLKQSLAAEDWSAVADSLGYDLEAEAGDWAAMLRSMATTIGGGEREES